MPSLHANEWGQPVGAPLPEWKAAARPMGDPLIGESIRLERFDTDTHLPSLHRHSLADVRGSGWTYLPYGPFPTWEDHLRWAERYVSSSTVEHPDPLLYALVSPLNGDVQGHAAFMRIEPQHGVLEIGHVYFTPSLQRTRAATEAIYLLLNHAFSLGYRRVEWKCHHLNVASRQAATRLGFQHEGLFRQAAVIKGRNRDTDWFSLLDHEWPLAHEAFRLWLHADNFDSQGQQKMSLTAIRSQLIPADPSLFNS